MAKNLVLGLILAHLAQTHAAKNFFSKNLLHQSLDVMVSYHHVKYQKKTILRKLSDGWTTYGQMDRPQINKGDFIGCCLTSKVQHKATNEFPDSLSSNIFLP